MDPVSQRARACSYVCVCVFGVLTAGTGPLWSPWWYRSTCLLTPRRHLHDHYTCRLGKAEKHRWGRGKKRWEIKMNNFKKEQRNKPPVAVTKRQQTRWRTKKQTKMSFLQAASKPRGSGCRKNTKAIIPTAFFFVFLFFYQLAFYKLPFCLTEVKFILIWERREWMSVFSQKTALTAEIWVTGVRNMLHPLTCLQSHLSSW